MGLNEMALRFDTDVLDAFERGLPDILAIRARTLRDTEPLRAA